VVDGPDDEFAWNSAAEVRVAWLPPRPVLSPDGALLVALMISEEFTVRPTF
jgi:hypothetical protein